MASETRPEALRLTLFGPFDARVEDRPLPRLRTRKVQWALALLALRPDREVDRRWLAGTLWPDSLESDALENLRQSLTNLRRALGNQAYRIQSPSLHTLRLDLSEAFVDVAAFDAAIARGDLPSLQQAVALYRGPLLEGCAEEWVITEREAREQSYLHALETLTARALEGGDPKTAVLLLRQIVARDPLRESAQRALMQALAEVGDHAAAIQVYRDLRLLLYRELHAEPDAQTTQVYQQLRAQARSNAPAAPPPTGAVPPTRSLPAELPRSSASFVGRQEAIEEVADRLASARLVTLTGSGGVGKTCLALAVAEAKMAEFADGVWFVDLSALTEEALVAQAVAAVLKLREDPNRSLLDTLTDYLHTKAGLLILDNCEHLIGGCSQLAAQLSAACPRLRILATSRQALGLPGEQIWRVPSLSLPEKESLPEPAQLMKYEAIRLFVLRAQQHQPEFQPTPQNAPALIQLCRRLDGIPFALELAAARMNILTVEQIAARLDDRFRLLTGGSRQALPRRQTLQAAMDWSYQLLSEPERLLLRRLAIFAGSWTLEAAEAVCSGVGGGVSGVGKAQSSSETSVTLLPTESQAGNAIPETRHPTPYDVLDLLASLAEKSLILVETHADQARYRLLETIRQYGLEKLRACGEADTLQRRHRDWYQQQTERKQEPEQESLSAWVVRLESDYDNLREALAWSRKQSGADDGAFLALCAALSRFWYMRGYLSEGRRWLEAALAREEDTAAPIRAQALLGAANLAGEQADYAQAEAFGNQSLELFRRQGDRSGMAQAFHSLGYVEHLRGRYSAARAHYASALALWQELGNAAGAAHCTNNIGLSAYSEGDFETALPLCEQSLHYFRAHRDAWGLSIALNILSLIACYQGEYARAWVLSQEALALRQELGDQRGVALSLNSLGWIAASRQEYAEAETLCGQSLRLAWELGDRQGLADALENLGLAVLEQGDPKRAARLYGAAAGLRAGFHIPPRPVDQPAYERHLAALQSALGKEAFDGAWAEGQVMPLEKAVAYALEEIP